MTSRELFDAYPAVTHAVAWTELFVCARLPDDPPDVPTSWEFLMSARPALTPAEVVTAIRGAAAEETVGKTALAVEEMGRPEYLTYIAGRMGMM